MCEVNNMKDAVDKGAMGIGQASAGMKSPQPIQDTEETAAYKQALDRRMDYLRHEMEKVYEARNYMRTEDWQLRARVHETINRAVAGKQD